jgi:hypothetical protein
VVEDIVSGHRRRRVRNRTLGGAATGVAAGTAVGLVAVASPRGPDDQPLTPAPRSGRTIATRCPHGLHGVRMLKANNYGHAPSAR